MGHADLAIPSSGDEEACLATVQDRGHLLRVEGGTREDRTVDGVDEEDIPVLLPEEEAPDEREGHGSRAGQTHAEIKREGQLA